MRDRTSLVSTLWLTASLMLLASALVTPTWTSGFVAVSSRSEDLGGEFALHSGQPNTSLDAAIPTDPVPPANVLPFEEEEQDWADALDRPRGSFLIPRPFRKVPGRPSIATRPLLSHYPLRC